MTVSIQDNSLGDTKGGKPFELWLTLVQLMMVNPVEGATEIQEQIMHYVTGIQWTKEYYQETYMAQ